MTTKWNAMMAEMLEMMKNQQAQLDDLKAQLSEAQLDNLKAEMAGKETPKAEPQKATTVTVVESYTGLRFSTNIRKTNPKVYRALKDARWQFRPDSKAPDSNGVWHGDLENLSDDLVKALNAITVTEA